MHHFGAVVLLTMLSMWTTAATGQQATPEDKHLGKGEERLNTIIYSLKRIRRYNPMLPPPTNGNATRVQLKLKDIEVKEFNNAEGKEKLVIETILVSEWKDSRISFGEPEEGGTRHSYFRSFTPEYIHNRFVQFSIWWPSIMYRDMKVVEDPFNDVTLIGENGMIHTQQRIRLQPTFLSYSDRRDGMKNPTFQLQLTETRFTTKDVLPEWGHQPFTFYKGVSSVETTSTVGQRSYRIEAAEDLGLSGCKREEDYGVFGKAMYGCVTVSFKLTNCSAYDGHLFGYRC